jgi:hypothetical protein
MGEPSVAGAGRRVRLDADKGQEAPAGVWRCVDRSSQGTAHWWLQPVDADARTWLAAPHCPLKLIQGCISYPSRLMRPPDVAALF